MGCIGAKPHVRQTNMSHTPKLVMHIPQNFGKGGGGGGACRNSCNLDTASPPDPRCNATGTKLYRDKPKVSPTAGEETFPTGSLLMATAHGLMANVGRSCLLRSCDVVSGLVCVGFLLSSVLLLCRVDVHSMLGKVVIITMTQKQWNLRPMKCEQTSQ